MAIEPYLFFNGRCEEAIEFDKKALGAEVLMVMRYKESPEPPLPGKVPAGWDNKIMHTGLRIGNANVMASDGRSPMADRCRCRWPRPFFHPASGWSLTALACRG